jgi:uncharacterized protein YxeA
MTDLRAELRKKPIILFIVGILLIALIICGLLLLTNKKPDASQSLVDKVKKISKSEQCNKAGYMQLSQYTQSAENSSTYSTQAKEKLLNYLVSCSYSLHYYSQTIDYADSLENIYKNNHQVSKAESEVVLVNYIKNTEKIST